MCQNWVLIADNQLYFLVHSGTGISSLSLYLELGSYTTMMMYNYCHGYAFLSYLEYPVLLIQEYALIYLVLSYRGLLTNNTYAITAAYFATMLAFGYSILPKFLLALIVVCLLIDKYCWSSLTYEFSNPILQPFCTPIGATSKIIQLLEIVRSKDSTTVSLTSWFLSAFTNLS